MKKWKMSIVGIFSASNKCSGQNTCMHIKVVYSMMNYQEWWQGNEWNGHEAKCVHYIINQQAKYNNPFISEFAFINFVDILIRQLKHNQLGEKEIR